MEKVTLLDQVEITRAGFVQVRIAKLVMDGGKEIASSWHRAAFAPAADITEHMTAINASLAGMGWPALDAASVQRVQAHAATAWTPEIVAAHEARVIAEQDRLKAEALAK
ncbi:MAG: hypothetical protein ACTS5I_07450 [Rhodanobacter sp.]